MFYAFFLILCKKNPYKTYLQKTKLCFCKTKAVVSLNKTTAFTRQNHRFHAVKTVLLFYST